MPNSLPPLILASASPRRRALLAALGLEFSVAPSGVDESAVTADSPRALAIKTAAVKAQAVAELSKTESPDALVLAADTMVVIDGRVLGKPASRAEARETLAMLAARSHTVITGVALATPGDGALWLHAESTGVAFRPLSAEWIEAYVASGESDDKAGSYGIQGQGRDLIERLDGELSNVIGLPLACLREGLLQTASVDILAGTDERAALLRAYPDLGDAAFFAGYHPPAARR